MGVGVYSWSQVPIREVSTQGVGMSGVSIQGGEYLGSECPGVSTWEVNYSGWVLRIEYLRAIANFQFTSHKVTISFLYTFFMIPILFPYTSHKVLRKGVSSQGLSMQGDEYFGDSTWGEYLMGLVLPH